jgi:hypothetical protein
MGADAVAGTEGVRRAEGARQRREWKERGTVEGGSKRGEDDVWALLGVVVMEYEI